VEDRIRTGRDCGIGHFPSESFAINTAWLAVSIIAATLLAWLRHLALDADLCVSKRRSSKIVTTRKRDLLTHEGALQPTLL